MSDESRERNQESLAQFFAGVMVFLVALATAAALVIVVGALL